MLRFTVNQQIGNPLHVQIKEQIKLALAFGELRPGDTLPSIRELATELNVGAGIVRRAYDELARAGVLSVNPSRRVVVNRGLRYKREGEGLKEKMRELADRVTDEALELGVHPQSFAQFYQHWLGKSGLCERMIIFTECNCPQAEQFADEAARAWKTPVQGISFDNLRVLSPAELKETRYLVTIPYHYEEVREIARKFRKEIVTVSVNWHPELLDRIKTVGPQGHAAFVFERQDLEQYGHLIVQELKGLLDRSGPKIECLALEDIDDPKRFCQKRNRDLVMFSNRIWESLPKDVRARSNVAMPRLKLDLVSLEKARIEMGVLS